MESNNFDRAQDTERKLRELSEKIWRTKAEKIKVQIRNRREVPVERLGDESFRVKNKDIDARSGNIIVLPSGERREIRWALPDRNRFDEFWIYFIAPKEP
ncbi:hypothetical protein J7M02_03970 [Candidatus Aerophobetes bacterium]|nr:hypothetical protein [Candidatus Aerophobetes bacterium]